MDFYGNERYLSFVLGRFAIWHGTFLALKAKTKCLSRLFFSVHFTTGNLLYIAEREYSHVNRLERNASACRVPLSLDKRLPTSASVSYQSYAYLFDSQRLCHSITE